MDSHADTRASDRDAHRPSPLAPRNFINRTTNDLTPHEISARDRHIAVLIFGFLLACYLFTFTGLIDSSDGLSTFATTENLVRRGSFDSNQLLWMGNQQGNIGADGNLYTRKGIGQVLLAAPLAWLGLIWPSVGIVHVTLLLNPLLTAWTGALLFRMGRRLGWRRSTSIATALLFGLATMAWPYTQGFFSDPVSAWGLFAAAYAMFAYAQSGRKHYLMAAGTAWGIAYLSRTINLMTLPIYLVGLFFVLDALTRQSAANTWRARLRAAFWQNWRPAVSFLLPVVAVGLLSLWWNWHRFGSFLDTGYVESESFSGDWLAGLWGLTFGPARGYFWYSPALLLAFAGVGWFWQRQRILLVLLLALVTLYVAVYAKWYMWHGGYSWGPRFLVPITPLLALLAGAGWGALVEQRRWGRAGVILAGLLVAVSVAVQWLGVLAPFALVQDWLAANVQPLFAPETFTRLEYSPLLLQWRYLTAEHIHLAWWRGGAGLEAVDWLALAMALAGIVVGLILLVQLARAPGDAPAEGSVRHTVYAFGFGLIALALLTYYHITLADPEMAIVARRIQAESKNGDAVLFLQPERTQAFANAYRGRLPVYGFFGANQLDENETAWLARLQATYSRLWVTPDYRAAEQSAWERTLRSEDYLLFDERISGPSNQRLSLYALAPAQNVAEFGLGTVFGDPNRTEPVTSANGWFRLNGYALPMTLQPGDALALSLLWESLRPVDYDYQVFVHFLDRDGNKVAQRDGQPVQWLRPTSTWQPGERIVDHYGLLLPDSTPTGRYTIAVGLYDPVTGQRLPVSAGPSSYAIELGPVEIQ
jgi:hypothetical protein